jgi:hypothetical protein
MPRVEDLLVEVRHHLDAGLNHHERRRSGEPNVDANGDLRLRAGGCGQEGQRECEEQGSPFHGAESTGAVVPWKRDTWEWCR